MINAGTSAPRLLDWQIKPDGMIHCMPLLDAGRTLQDFSFNKI
jgi:hypothetical protein